MSVTPWEPMQRLERLHYWEVDEADAQGIVATQLGLTLDAPEETTERYKKTLIAMVLGYCPWCFTEVQRRRRQGSVTVFAHHDDGCEAELIHEDGPYLIYEQGAGEEPFDPGLHAFGGMVR